ncbi:NifU family protein [Anaeromicropila populeti]|uniref:Fe-S cluster biogenesis protein NfuA, 4Fe-4S-binding domain n=1 Tax=Anaeromicropila populeti TaxID=37658 RepID=A0A1I6J0F3_9FIRM|nr:NifU family protein [Anaeromicropila populeti]SFR72408.1 Fe-S cluster biogenesis protein NfuA, 4Fe-4S-binding domain [Anaeromicropila populeti]
MDEISIEALEQAMDEKIRPELSLHGGDIWVEQLKDGVLHVRLLGQCSGCPSAELTMENVVNQVLKENFPSLKQVVLVTGVSDDLIQQAKLLLNRRKKQ